MPSHISGRKTIVEPPCTVALGRILDQTISQQHCEESVRNMSNVLSHASPRIHAPKSRGSQGFDLTEHIYTYLLVSQ